MYIFFYFFGSGLSSVYMGCVQPVQLDHWPKPVTRLGSSVRHTPATETIN